MNKNLKTTVELNNPDQMLITLDVDWAPDELCEYCVNILRKYKVKATFFATHRSDYLIELSKSDDIEIGIHPNYMGKNNYEAVIDELLKWYPNARSVRSHGLYSIHLQMFLKCIKKKESFTL